MTALRASRANKSFVHLFKGGGVQRQSLWPRSAERGIPLYAHKSAGGGLRGNPRRGFPLNFSSLSTCAPIRWEGVDGLSCLSTPFLWCLPKETVSSRQRKALFYPGGSTIRVSAPALVVGTFLARLGGGLGGCRGIVRVRRFLVWLSLLPAAIRPHFFGACPKKRCRAAKEKRF